MNKLIIIAAFSTMVVSCSNDVNSKSIGLKEKQAKLESLKKEKEKLEVSIKSLESEIVGLGAVSKEISKLVSVASVIKQDFTHFIELQGRVDVSDVVIVTPRGMPSQVKEIFFKKGDALTKGQLLLKLDDAIIVQQLDALNTQLVFAKNIFDRQQNLWNQNIGTEVQLISSKNAVDAIEKQIATAKESWKTTFVYAPISGIAEDVNVKVGEIFLGVNGLGPQIRIINISNMKVVTEVPETYAARVKKGTAVQIVIPDLNKTYNSTIKIVGASININTRTFSTESQLPSDAALRLNQIAVVKIKDYFAPNVISIPINFIQTDENGKHVFVAEQIGNKLIAKKRTIIVGESFGGMIEVKTGLTTNDKIITEGYQTVYDGQAITTNNK